jgi:NADH-quinone oxidoreductase subunit C
MLAELNTQLESSILKHSLYAGELTITVSADHIVEVMTTLRDTYGFSYLVDIVAIDRYTDEERFEVAYNVFNLAKNQRLRVKVMLEEANPELDSITGVYPAADWNEREAWDMMGIRFRNHPDLRRIYLPEDFEYHPLRKEFPLIGIPGTLPLPNNAE